MDSDTGHALLQTIVDACKALSAIIDAKHPSASGVALSGEDDAAGASHKPEADSGLPHADRASAVSNTAA
jgi:hypothetical protein